MDLTTDGAGGGRTRPEIEGQPASWRGVAAALPDLGPFAAAFDPLPDELVLTGCGTSYYLAQAAAAVFRRVAGLRASAVPASELVLFPDLALPPGGRIVVIGISRSGETSETVRAVAVAAARGHAAYGVGCEADSSLARACRGYLALPGGRDESMVMTKSATTMLLALQRVAGLVARDGGYLAELDALAPFADDLGYARADRIAALARDPSWERVLLLGAGPLQPIAAEAAMKLTEMALLTAVPYHPLEFRHGPMSIVDGRALVILLACASARDEEAALLRDIAAHGGRLLVLADDPAGLAADEALALGAGVGDYARQVLYLPPLQLLGYFRAQARGIDPDAPRHLSRFVALDWSAGR